MRAELTADGMLRIIPENSTEDYALRCWWHQHSNKPMTNSPTNGALCAEYGLRTFTPQSSARQEGANA